VASPNGDGSRIPYEYVAFKQFAPELDIGFDLSKEYAEAKRIKALGL
jgi:hypothetical protein